MRGGDGARQHFPAIALQQDNIRLDFGQCANHFDNGAANGCRHGCAAVFAVHRRKLMQGAQAIAAHLGKTR